ncbi:hypothetical protein, partial [Paraburkholderia dilworthii]
MGLIADNGDIKQPDGNFLRWRTHTPDPLLPVEPSRVQGQVSETSSRSVLPFVDEKSTGRSSAL